MLGSVFQALPILFSTYSDVWILRQTTSFKDRVRGRDQCCVVSGTRVPSQDFTIFQAAHIFPVAHLDIVWLPLRILLQSLVLYVYCLNFSSMCLLIRCRSGILASGARRLKTTTLRLRLAIRRFILSKTAYFCCKQPTPASTSTSLLLIQT
jgi:hypothetical protein